MCCRTFFDDPVRPKSATGRGAVPADGGKACEMAIVRRTFTIRVARDWAVEALSLGAVCGAVLCAGVAGGVEAAGGIALLAVRSSPGRATGRYRGLRFDDHTWAVVGTDGTPIAIDPPVVHFSHRAAIVLEVFASDRSDFLVFTPIATPSDDLRRLRVHLRAGGRSR